MLNIGHITLRSNRLAIIRPAIILRITVDIIVRGMNVLNPAVIIQKQMIFAVTAICINVQSLIAIPVNHITAIIVLYTSEEDNSAYKTSLSAASPVKLI